MPDELDLMQLASSGQKLARLDGTDYLAVHLVLAWESGGVPSVYCAYQNWPTSPIARLAAKEEEIAELAAILDKWAQETTVQTQRAEAALTRVAELEMQLAERQEPPPADLICPDCGKGGWRSAKALQMHRQRTHQGMVAMPHAPAQPLQFVEDLGWRCAAKGCAGAHARDLHDPAFCTLHAQRQITNGQEIAA